MKNAINTLSELKLELFRFIDKLPEKKLQNLHNLIILNKKDDITDFWDLLSTWEKEDIEKGISDIENGKFKSLEEVLAKY